MPEKDEHSLTVKAIEWVGGFRSQGVDVEEAVDAINDLKAKLGHQPTAEDIAKVAKGKRHVLHSLVYDVDENKAAIRYYRDNARKILRSIHITYEEAPESPVRYYQLEQIKTPGTAEVTTYRSVDEMMSEPELRNHLLEEAKVELGYFKKRYGHLKELAAVFEAFDDVE